MTDLLPADGAVVMFMMVRRPDGTPTGYPMTGTFRGGQLEVTTYRKAAKARALLADGRVCCVVPDPAVPGRGVALRGRAVEVSAEGYLGSVRHGIGESPIAVPEWVRESVQDRLESEKRMVFRIDVEQVTQFEPWSDDAA